MYWGSLFIINCCVFVIPVIICIIIVGAVPIHRVSLITRTDAEFGMYFKGENNILIAILMPIVHCVSLYLLLRVLDVRSTGGKSKEALNCLQNSRVNDIPEDNQDHIADEDEDVAEERSRVNSLQTGAQGTKRGAILTTHYMEEADALCSRVAIMVNGRMECLGPTQHLKDKYGSGYLLEVKLKTGDHEHDVEARMNSLERHLVSLFPQASCLERFEERGQYKIPKDNVKSLAFGRFEEYAKHTHDVEEYSLSQSTLEQVFLDFAKKQVEEGEEEEDMPKSLNRQLSAGGGDRGSVNNGNQDANLRM